MKQNIIIILFSILSTSIFAQSVPQGFNFQAVARDDAGNIVANQVIGIRISLVPNSNPNNIIYRESQFPSSSDLGVFSIVVGQGAADIGDFQTIDWGVESLNIRTE